MSSIFRPDRWSGNVFAVLVASLGLAGQAHAQREAESLSASFRKAADKILPAVVAVRPAGVMGRVGPLGAPGRPLFPGGPGPIPSHLLGPDQLAGGSGIIVEASRGLILTSEQAVAGAPRAVVTFDDGREVESKRLVRDPQTELVLLAVDPRSIHLKEVEWGDSQALQLGDWVLAIGRSSAHVGTVSAGIVSSRVQSAQDDVLRTDAVVGSAGSGGPLVNLEGRIVGINLARLGPRGWADGFGLAIPAERARHCVSDLAEFGQVRRGYLGIMVAPAGGLALDQRGQSAGLMITGVTVGSPAADARLMIGDRIIMLDGKPIMSRDDFSKTVDEAPIGQEFRLTIERAGNRQELKVATKPRPQEPIGPLGFSRPGARARDRAATRTRRPAGRRPGDHVIRSEGPDDEATPPPAGLPGSALPPKEPTAERPPRAEPRPSEPASSLPPQDQFRE